ncbi:hypothetical protein EVAR_29348_1 [Eumeta japonica]|uniref:Uncharacterized protein n=1 Tax=Eumeta variegata TaxID=151549 RepID=A0A4C1WJT8_EUMVA|nr:hypothetical protein EVAR_29348_1 [Eumeta japonica]
MFTASLLCWDSNKQVGEGWAGAALGGRLGGARGHSHRLRAYRAPARCEMNLFYVILSLPSWRLLTLIILTFNLTNLSVAIATDKTTSRGDAEIRPAERKRNLLKKHRRDIQVTKLASQSALGISLVNRRADSRCERKKSRTATARATRRSLRQPARGRPRPEEDCGTSRVNFDSNTNGPGTNVVNVQEKVSLFSAARSPIITPIPKSVTSLVDF